MPANPPAVFTPPSVPSPSAPGAVHAVAAASPSVPGAVHSVPSASPAAPGAVHEVPVVGGGGSAVAASATLDPVGTNNAMVFTAVTPGTAGNDISVEILTPAATYNHPATGLQTIYAPVVIVNGSALSILPSTQSRILASSAGTTAANGHYGYINNDLWINPATGWKFVKISNKWEIQDSGGVVHYTTGIVVSGPPTNFIGSFTATGPGVAPAPGLALAVSSAAQLVSAVNAFAYPIAAANAPANDGSGAVAAVAQTSLSGGVDGSGLTTPPAIHSAPAASPATPPAITP